MRSPRADKRSPRDLILIALVGVLLGGAILAINLYTAWRLENHILPSTPYADVFSKLDDPVDILFALGDGQAFLALARDPTLSHLDAFRNVRSEASLRASRPLQGYLGWVFSAGRPKWAEEGVVIATVLGCGIGVFGCALLLHRRRVNPWLALLVLELPGALAGIRQLGPEVLGLGLVAIALVTRDDDRPWVSVFLFALAGLARETYLLIPLLLAWRERKYLIAPATWLAWVLIVWARFGEFAPFVKQDQAGLLGAPFVGLARALPHLRFPVFTALVLTAIPLVAIVTWKKRRGDPLTPIVVAYALFAAFFSRRILLWWASFSRPLLPMTAFALIALLTSSDQALDGERSVSG